MLKTCSAPNCSTLTLGSLCIAHEPAPARRRYPRGRPYRRHDREAGKIAAPALAGAGEHTSRVVSLESAG
jgi:hypothetical protein